MNAKEEDRHIGRREAVWFPQNEHAALCKAMALVMERNKSRFIRAAVHHFIHALTHPLDNPVERAD